MAEDCGREECGNCVRRDVDILDDRVHLTTYHGKYVVQTTMAHELGHPSVGLSIILAPPGSKLKSFPSYETRVCYVGSESASVMDSIEIVPNDEFYRWHQRHGNDNQVRDVHQMVLDGLKGGVLDVSTPMTLEELQEESDALLSEYGFIV